MDGLEVSWGVEAVFDHGCSVFISSCTVDDRKAECKRKNRRERRRRGKEGKGGRRGERADRGVGKACR